MDRFWPAFLLMQVGIMQPATRERSTPSSRTQYAEATRFAFVATRRTASSSAIAGVPPGVTKASGTPRRSTSTMPSSTSLTASHCKTDPAHYQAGARTDALFDAPANSQIQDFLGVLHAA